MNEVLDSENFASRAKNDLMHDVTMPPKKLDDTMEKADKDGALRSTKLTVNMNWRLQRQENILASARILSLSDDMFREEEFI